MSPRFIEIDGRGVEHLIADVPDCNGRFRIGPSIEVVVYMDGVNPTTNSNLLAAEITGFEGTIVFPLSHSGVGETSARTLLGDETRLKAELHQPLSVQVGGELRPNPNLIQGVA